MAIKHKIHILMKQNLNTSITKISLSPKADRVDLIGQQSGKNRFQQGTNPSKSMCLNNWAKNLHDTKSIQLKILPHVD